MKILLTISWFEPANDPQRPWAVRNIGGASGDFHWQHSEAQAIHYLENGLFDYFVKWEARNLKINVATTAQGDKYLTVANGSEKPLSQFALSAHA